MTNQEAMLLIEEALATDAGVVKGPDQTLSDIGWDSMASLSLIALIDERVQRELDAKRIAKCRTVADLTALILENS